MKNKFIISLAALAMASTAISCGPSAETLAAKSTSDSLSMVVAQKDSIINDAFANIDVIASTLSQISERQNIVTGASSGTEINKTQKDQIKDNLMAISDLLEKNRTALSKLNATAKKLKEANVKIEALESLVASLQKQIEGKDVQIAELAQKIESLNITIAGLNNLTAELQSTKTELESTVKDQDSQINTVYFVVGSDKDLMAKNIIDKKGFIGRTRTVKNTSDLTDFTKADKRNLDRVTIGAKSAKVVSAHPDGSYTLVKSDKNVFEELVITDPNEFWRNTQILIVSHR